MNEFRALDPDLQEDVIDYLKDALLYQEAEAGGKRYLLVHAGLGNFSEKKKFADYTIDCSACHENGRLAAICLDTGREFYS